MKNNNLDINSQGLFLYKKAKTKNDLIKVFNYFEQAIKKNPYCLPLYANCCLVCRDLNMYDKAIQYGKKIVEDSFYDFKYCRILANLYNKLNKNEEENNVWKKCQKNGKLINYLQRSTNLIKGLESKPWWDKKDIKKEYTDLLINNFSIIKEELLNLINFKNFTEKDSEKLTELDKGWTKFALYHKGIKNIENCKKCPKTTKIVENILDATTNIYGQIEFSKLESDTHIIPHCAYTNTRLRIHLGLIIPKGCTIICGNVKKQWIEGDCIILDDSYIHEVYHKGTEDRYILIVDIWHKDLNTISKRYNVLENPNDKLKYINILFK